MNKPTNDNLASRVPVALFELGQLVATRGAIASCSTLYMEQYLARHVRGDWGVVCGEDRKSNFEALREKLRIPCMACPGQSDKRKGEIESRLAARCY